MRGEAEKESERRGRKRENSCLEERQDAPTRSSYFFKKRTHPDKKKKKERKAGRTTPPCRLLATRRATSPKPPNIPGRRGCGASTRSNNCRKKTTDQSLGLLVIWRPASSHEVRQPWQEGRGQRGGRRQECQQARAGPDQPGCGVARLQNQN